MSFRGSPYDSWPLGFGGNMDLGRGPEFKVLQELTHMKAQLSSLVQQVQQMQKESSEAIKEAKERMEYIEEKLENIEAAQSQNATTSICHTNPRDLIPLAIIKDIFDFEFVNDLEGAYATKIWSELEEDIKMKMVSAVKNSLIAEKLQVPPEREITNRLKGFYSNRRSSTLIKSDGDKKKKRKLSFKASRRTYVARQEAVKKAIKDGSLDPCDDQQVSRIRKSIPQVPLGCVSSPDSSGDEELVQRKREKKLHSLARARAAKKRRREESSKNTTMTLNTSTRSKNIISDNGERATSIEKVTAIDLDESMSILAPNSMLDDSDDTHLEYSLDY